VIFCFKELIIIDFGRRRTGLLVFLKVRENTFFSYFSQNLFIY